MDHITAIEEQLASPIRETGQTDLATRHKHGVSSLLAQRDDLRGVHAFADVVEESVRWSA
ncbi:MAG: hypothetical protein JWR90_3863 [Marmoricola sp.]|jgi:hypothetical protein|nr:hypothetical protein [Marmoricola sp.]